MLAGNFVAARSHVPQIALLMTASFARLGQVDDHGLLEPAIRAVATLASRFPGPASARPRSFQLRLSHAAACYAFCRAEINSPPFDRREPVKGCRSLPARV